MTDHDLNCVEAKVVYRSVRDEILDQKRCQFQIFGAALTLSTAVLAYGVSRTPRPFVYAAPMIMNVMTLTVIMDKALSIQRMVGYLQLMESIQPPAGGWMWEYHLNLFRDLKKRRASKEDGDSWGKHRYVRNVSLMLMVLNAVFLLLYFFGPETVPLKVSLNHHLLWLWAIDGLVIALNIFGVCVGGYRLWQLVRGPMSSKGVRKGWKDVFSQPFAEFNQAIEMPPRRESLSVPLVSTAQATGTGESGPFLSQK
jgi:hypothetical protein